MFKLLALAVKAIGLRHPAPPSAADASRADDPCLTCVTAATWDDIFGWLLAPCGDAPCAPGTGHCFTENYFFAEPGLPASDYVRCNCTQGNPACNCRGIVRNPLFRTDQAPTMVFCETLLACTPITSACKVDHLLSLPVVTVPVCLCQ